MSKTQGQPRYAARDVVMAIPAMVGEAAGTWPIAHTR
jgi:hypothetical protein